MSNLVGYELSAEAESDLNEIFDYTQLEYGFDQAINYLMSLDVNFKNLVMHPEIGRRRDEIRIGLLSITEQQHVIFYRILKKNVRIVRVLHGRKDIPNKF